MSDQLPAFPDAAYYDCRDDQELLEWRDPIEAIREHYSYDSSVDDIKDGCVVHCYRRMKPPGHFPDRAACDIMDLLNEHHLVEDLQNPDDDEGMFAPLADEYREKFAALVREMADRVEPWSCEEFAKVEVSAEQLEAILRVELPEMFEEPERFM